MRVRVIPPYIWCQHWATVSITADGDSLNYCISHNHDNAHPLSNHANSCFNFRHPSASMSTFNPSLNPSDSAATIHEVPPSTRYGWVVVCGVFIINAHTWGLNAVRAYTSQNSTLQLSSDTSYRRTVCSCRATWMVMLFLGQALLRSPS